MSAIALALLLTSAVVIRGALKGLSPWESFTDIFSRAGGGPGVPSTPGAPGRSWFPLPPPNPAAGQFGVNVERWRALVAAYFPPGVVNEALSVMACESQGNPNATNPDTRAAGLFQHMPAYWSDRSRRAGVPGANIYEPTANVKVAAWLYSQSGTWSHWSCKPTV